MSEQSEVWGNLIAPAYEKALEYQLRDAAKWADLWQKDHDEWWAKQTRWFKIRYRIHGKVSGWSYDVRQWIANRIFPEGRSYE